MKIKLKWDLPVNKEHGLTKGRVLEVIGPPGGRRPEPGEIWVASDIGGQIRVIGQEYEVVEK